MNSGNVLNDARICLDQARNIELQAGQIFLHDGAWVLVMMA